MQPIAITLLAISALSFATGASAQVTLHEQENFQGRSFTARQRIPNMQRMGFQEHATSAVVTGDRWQVCERAHQHGRCMVLRPGSYPSLASMGLTDRIASVRPVRDNEFFSDSVYAPLPSVAQDAPARQERLFDATVTGTRAVAATATAPAYWLVSYTHRGVKHRVQMSKPPGATITVNRRGEPTT